jgi:hypothetical protein
MRRITVLLVGVAALMAISTVASAEDGCGRGWYHDGRQCVPEDELGYDYPPCHHPTTTRHHPATAARRHHQATTCHHPTMSRPRIAGCSCGLISMRRDTPHRIPPSRHGTTARRISLFRMGW